MVARKLPRIKLFQETKNKITLTLRFWLLNWTYDTTTCDNIRLTTKSAKPNGELKVGVKEESLYFRNPSF